MPFERHGQKFELIDTAGLRRKGKVFEAIEKFSVVKTLQAIADANVVLLLLDATQGVTDQDAHIAGYILDSGRAVVLAVNKWDAVDDYQREQLQRSIEQRLAFLKIRAACIISAKKRQGLGRVEGDRRGACLGDAQDADAGADAPAARGGGAPGAEARRHVPPQAALCPPGRHEPAHHRHPRQFAFEHVTDSLQALPGRALSARTSSWSARRSSIEMRSSRNPFDDK